MQQNIKIEERKNQQYYFLSCSSMFHLLVGALKCDICENTELLGAPIFAGVI